MPGGMSGGGAVKGEIPGGRQGGSPNTILYKMYILSAMHLILPIYNS